jgi:hypothetical protein
MMRHCAQICRRCAEACRKMAQHSGRPHEASAA